MAPPKPAVALAVLLAALLLAGCSGGKAKDDAAPDADAPGALPLLHGYVFDPTLKPLQGATVKVLDTNSSGTTDSQGFFGFDGLPTERFLVVVATLDGYVPQSKQVTLSPEGPTRLNFTLQPVPVQVPYMQTAKQDLLVECQVGTVVNGENKTTDCSTGAANIDHWDIAVGPDLTGAVVEVFWDPSSAAATSVGARLETLELGQLNLNLGEVVGGSPLRLQVPQVTANRYYASGGLMRLTIFAASDAEATESTAGATVLFQQPLTAYASLFYIAPPDPAYTIQDQQ
jgi:hypothetical protein